MGGAMAAPPVKSRPLHNFALPLLKWGNNSSSSSSRSTLQHDRFCLPESPDQLHQRLPHSDSKPETDGDFAEEENEAVKPWKLRPRNEIIKAASYCTTVEDNYNSNVGSSKGVNSQRMRGGGMVEGRPLSGRVERKQKRKVWISLTREEIEEDVYALTGGRPSRRPKKWPKNVQKQLDCLFPGLYLVGVAPESYRVHDALR